MNFSFASIVAKINERLQLLNDFKDVLFHSTYQRIVDLMAFISEKIAYLAEYFYREASWKNAQNRSSLNNQSYWTSYTPHRKSGAGGAIYLSGSPTFDPSYIYAGDPVFIDKYHRISDTGRGSFVYVTEAVTYYKGTVGNLTLSVKEGIPKTFIYTATGVENETITLFSDSVDNDVIEIDIIDVDGNVLYPVTIIDEPYFVNELTNYYCKVENAPDFSAVYIIGGDNRYTRTFIANQLIRIRYIETKGDLGNIEGINSMTVSIDPFVDSQGNTVPLFVTNPEPISDGRGYESLESIRNNGRRLFYAGYRLGSTTDWETLLNQTPYVQKSKVWTKADLGLPATGLDQNVVYISAVSNSGDALTSSQQLDIIYNYIFPKKDPTDVISFQTLEKISVRFDSDIYAINVPEIQIIGEVNKELQIFDISNMDFAENIYFSNYTKSIDMAASVDHHDSLAWYVEQFDEAGERFGIFKYSYTLRPTKSGDSYYPSSSPFREDDPDKQILLIPGEFEIWVRRKVSGSWKNPVKVARANASLNTIDGIKYIALNDLNLQTTNPGVNDDSSSGNYVGRIWKNTISNAYYECLDDTVGAAVWQNLSLSTAGIPTVNTDSSLGFSIGSVLYDSATGDFYQCSDNTVGAAAWAVRNNISGFGQGDQDFEPDYRSFTWSITGDAIDFTTNVISYEIRTIIDDSSSYGVINPTETDPNGFIVYLSYRMQDGNGLQDKDIRLGGFAQILDFDPDLNTFSINY